MSKYSRYDKTENSFEILSSKSVYNSWLRGQSQCISILAQATLDPGFSLTWVLKHSFARWIFDATAMWLDSKHLDPKRQILKSTHRSKTRAKECFCVGIFFVGMVLAESHFHPLSRCRDAQFERFRAQQYCVAVADRCSDL